MQTIFYLDNHEHVALCDLLKLSGAADSGGQAKVRIAAGAVCRNGVAETRKTAKIRAGETVSIDGLHIVVQSGSAP